MPNNLTVELPDLPSHGLVVPGTGRELTGALPLRGITVLAVEDSRFASEALRLMCQRLGARLRRAETIHAARSHLKLYRPNVVIVDLGLPDGRGEALIREIVMGARPPVVLGTSGDAAGRSLALAAGAEGFLDKPLESLSMFQATLIHHLPEQIIGMTMSSEAPLHPDSLALRDDFARAAALIEAGTTAETQAYLTGFLTGVARHAHDTALAEASESARLAPQAGRLDHLRAMLHRRLEGADAGFGATQGPG
jgi:CheY-like chemotaxis protein